jgi:hypothetical protein
LSFCSALLQVFTPLFHVVKSNFSWYNIKQ